MVNREHVLPKWNLRKYDPYDKEINLPHQYHGRRYGRQTIPCCKDSNSLLGRKLEQPVRRLTEGGYAKRLRHLDDDGHRLLFAMREHLPHLKIAGSDMSALQAIRENRLTFLDHRMSRAATEIEE